MRLRRTKNLCIDAELLLTSTDCVCQRVWWEPTRPRGQGSANVHRTRHTTLGAKLVDLGFRTLHHVQTSRAYLSQRHCQAVRSTMGIDFPLIQNASVTLDTVYVRAFCVLVYRVADDQQDCVVCQRYGPTLKREA